ncbi:hypothetical protein PILCRDRAFT_813395 [Piloderma croceum F 1598]|uniref:Uncharacterized protein n=1 Tax=Piloderma croceum (strain F 1598) TaxID=765440 RepID=A0A0C3CI43_PILCF|nr:hypothetical protein PILCRDRAFT_813395 [Piloderma croceum F 1598]
MKRTVDQGLIPASVLKTRLENKASTTARTAGANMRLELLIRHYHHSEFSPDVD